MPAQPAGGRYRFMVYSESVYVILRSSFHQKCYSLRSSKLIRWKNMQTLQAVYQNWMVKEHNFNANTVHAYLADYRDWANWCKNDESLIKDPALLDFEDFFNEKLHHLKPSSILRKYKSLRRFYHAMVVLQVISKRGGLKTSLVLRVWTLLLRMVVVSSRC